MSSGAGAAVAKTVAAVLAAAAAVVLGLNGSGLIDAPDRLVVTGVVTSAVLAAGSTVVSAWAEWRRRRLGAQRELVDIQLTGAGWAVVDQVGGGLDYRDLGLAAYRVQRLWWHPSRERLRRIYRVRASRRPATSNIDWGPGKGVIGACVTRGEVVAVDLRQLYDDLGEPGPADWADLPDDVRLGLTYEEYLDVRDKYDVVVATPVIDDSHGDARVLGCLSLDGPAGRFDDLTSDEVLSLLGWAAQGLLHRAS
jgi:hypothetical protein